MFPVCEKEMGSRVEAGCTVEDGCRSYLCHLVLFIDAQLPGSSLSCLIETLDWSGRSAPRTADHTRTPGADFVTYWRMLRGFCCFWFLLEIMGNHYFPSWVPESNILYVFKISTGKLRYKSGILLRLVILWCFFFYSAVSIKFSRIWEVIKKKNC